MPRPERPITRINPSYRNQQDAQAQLERTARRKKHLKQRLIIVGMAFMVIFGVMFTYHMKQRSAEAELQTEYNELNQELSGLMGQKENLQEEIGLLNDKEYILDIARTNYFLSKKGELIFQTEEQDERAY